MGKAFDRLERRVEREYRAKGFGQAHAEYVARAVAGQIALRKRRARRNPTRRKRKWHEHPAVRLVGGGVATGAAMHFGERLLSRFLG